MPDNRDFPVEWNDPADAAVTWRFGGDHTPDPMTPLSIDYAEAVISANAHARGTRTEETRRSLYVHGYLYGPFSQNPILKLLPTLWSRSENAATPRRPLAFARPGNARPYLSCAQPATDCKRTTTTPCRS